MTRLLAAACLLSMLPGPAPRLAAQAGAAPRLTEGPRPLTDRGLMNVVAFARLVGYVRHFHPSDEAARTDWPAFTVDGMRAIESAATVDALERVFRPIAPAVEVFAVSARPVSAGAPLAARANTRVLAWRHLGFGGGAVPPYRSERIAIDRPPAPLDVQLGGGVAARVPLAVLADERGTLPRGAAPAPAATARRTFAPTDRAVRLAAVALAWDVPQHFYPYFEIVRTDWPAILPLALQQVALDATVPDVHETLERMFAGLRDAQARVTAPDGSPMDAGPAVALDWVEGRLVVAAAAASTGLRAGDSVVAVDGAPAPLALEDRERSISGATPQWIRNRAVRQLLWGPPETDLTLGIERAGTPRRREAVTLRRRRDPFAAEARRPAVSPLDDGVMYADLTRLTDAELSAALPRLASATGLVFDLRGQSAAIDPSRLFRHLSQMPLTAPQRLLPEVTRPDRVETSFVPVTGWTFPPEPPYLAAPKVFLADATSVGAAESYLAMVQHYGVGEIVGAPTAGTDGAINQVPLPGGFTAYFTGMTVLRQDGAPLHGLGVRPDVSVTRTRAALAEGRDELMERALEVLKAQLPGSRSR